MLQTAKVNTHTSIQHTSAINLYCFRKWPPFKVNSEMNGTKFHLRFNCNSPLFFAATISCFVYVTVHSPLREKVLILAYCPDIAQSFRSGPFAMCGQHVRSALDNRVKWDNLCLVNIGSLRQRSLSDHQISETTFITYLLKICFSFNDSVSFLQDFIRFASLPYLFSRSGWHRSLGCFYFHAWTLSRLKISKTTCSLKRWKSSISLNFQGKRKHS